MYCKGFITDTNTILPAVAALLLYIYLDYIKINLYIIEKTKLKSKEAFETQKVARIRPIIRITEASIMRLRLVKI